MFEWQHEKRESKWREVGKERREEREKRGQRIEQSGVSVKKDK